MYMYNIAVVPHILEYHPMVDTIHIQTVPNDETANDEVLAERVRNGVNRGTQNYQQVQTDESYATYLNRRAQVQANRGLHESFDFYDDCYARERNRGRYCC